jgi:2-polyprenyl-3-methyl-5-hydroxy-6-metoxy-1,4-benzoquinol methylase
MEPKYSDLYESETDFDNVLLAHEFRILRDRITGPVVLEMGCGGGTTTQMLSRLFPDLHVVDGSRRCLQLASARVPSSVQFHCSAFETFSPSVRYDSIVMTHILEHVDNAVEILRCARRWLKNGGTLHIIVPNANSLHRRIGVAMGLLPTVDSLNERDASLGHLRVYTMEKLNRDLVNANLKVLHQEGILLKILNNAQMEKLDPKLVEALFALSHELPDYCADLYVHAAPV